MKEYPELELVKVEPELTDQEKLQECYKQLMIKLELLERKIAKRKAKKLG